MNFLDEYSDKKKKKEELVNKFRSYHIRKFSLFKKKHLEIIEEAEKTFTRHKEELKRLNYFNDKAISMAYEKLERRFDEKDVKFFFLRLFGDDSGINITNFYIVIMGAIAIYANRDNHLYELLDVSNELINIQRSITNSMAERMGKERSLNYQTIEGIIKETFPNDKIYRSFIDSNTLTNEPLMRGMSIIFANKHYNEEEYPLIVKSNCIMQDIDYHRVSQIMRNFVAYLTGILYDQEFIPLLLQDNPLERIRTMEDNWVDDIKHLKPELEAHRDNLKSLVDYDDIMKKVKFDVDHTEESVRSISEHRNRRY